MLVAAIADTHLPRGERRLPAECLERLAAADLIVHAGDVSSLRAFEELRAIGPPVHAVHGNTDEPALRELLPERLVVDAGEAHIGLVHIPGPAPGREARLTAAFPGCAAVVFGHTHLPVVERHDGVWLLNPGSPTERRRSPFHSMIEIEIEHGEARPELVRLE